MDTKEIDSKTEVINSYFEVLKSIIEVISSKLEVKSSNNKLIELKAEVSKFDTYLTKLITEVNYYKTELIKLKAEVSSSGDSINFMDEKLWKLLYKEMFNNEPGGKFYNRRVPETMSAIFLLIAKRISCNSYDIKTTFRIRHPSYLRYMKYMRRWNWVEYAPGRKKEIYVLSKKGNEILQKVLSA